MSLISQTLLLQTSAYVPPLFTLSPVVLSKLNFVHCKPYLVYSKSNFVPFSRTPKFTPSASVSLSKPNIRTANFTPSSSVPPSKPNIRGPKFIHLAPAIPCKPSQAQNQPPVDDSTRTLKTLLYVALSATLIVTKMVQSYALGTASQAPHALSTVGPLFFISVKYGPRGYLNRPLTVVASELFKWLEIYSSVIRILLSCFPNIRWDRQSLSAIKSLSDVYWNLFRNIIPPIFGTLDVSPLLAMVVLETLESILNSIRGIY